MPQPVTSIWRITAIACLVGARVQAADLHVSPIGRPSGPGTKERPFDIVTALSGSVGKPGDTFWIDNGVYQIGKLETKIQGAPGQPITFRQMPGQRVQLVGSLTLWDSAGYVIFRDFELYSGEIRRVIRQTGAGFKPTDLLNFTGGIQVYAPNYSFINLIGHDSVRSAFYTSAEATNTFIYG